jgi:hypothetical protein
MRQTEFWTGVGFVQARRAMAEPVSLVVIARNTGRPSLGQARYQITLVDERSAAL